MKEIKKSFWDFVVVSGSVILSVPIMIVSESIQARYLGPENYGKVALVIGAISLLYLFGLSWLQRIIMRFGKEEFLKENHLRKTTGNFVFLNILSFITVSLIFYSAQTPILNFLEIKNPYAFWVLIAGLSLIVTKEFIFEVLKVVRLIKLQQLLFRLASKLFIVSGILFLAFILLDVRVEYIIAVFFVSDFLVILTGFYFVKKSYLFPVLFEKRHIRKMLVYALPLLFTSWSGYMINWVDVYVIKYYMTMTDVGVYQASYKIMSTLKSFWGAGLITIFTPIIMVFKTDNDHAKVTNFYLKRLLPQISFLSMVIISVIILLSDYLFHFIYGAKFNGSILPFKILMASVSFSSITYTLMAVITSYDMTRYMFYVSAGIGVLNLVADIILVQYFGITGAAMASAFVFMIGPVTWYYIIKRRFKFKGYLALFFPFMTLLVFLANLSDEYSIRISLTVLIIFLTYMVGRQKNLFIYDDIHLLKNVNMPESVRRTISRLIIFFSREKDPDRS